MTYPVKWLAKSMLGAPTVHGNSGGTGNAPGGLFDVLKACLIDGFNVQVPTGMTYAAGPDEITIEFGATHGYVQHQIIKTSGADQAEYNGEFRVKGVSATAVTVPTHNGTPIPTATTATAFSCFTPPLDGWSVLYEVGSPTYELHLHRENVNSTGYELLVFNDVSYDTNPEVEGQFLAKMISVEDYVDEVTYTTRLTRYWPAGSDFADYEDWMMVGDQFQFCWTNKYAQNEGNDSTFTFGDINSIVKGDVGHCILNGTSNVSTTSRWDSESTSYPAHSPWTGWKNTNSNFNGMMTDYTGNPGIIYWNMRGMDEFVGSFVFPNPASNGFHVFAGPILVCEGTVGLTSHVRGHMPGYMQPMQNATVFHGKVLDQLPGLENIPVLFWRSSYAQYNDRNVYGKVAAWRLDNWQRDEYL